MSGSQVTVLCTNGRRTIVKTTPGLSILQVIENACQKQKLNPDLYDIKLLRRVLDPSSTIRFSNIPNNAQLELVEAASPRQACLVNISLATESGQRLVAEFPSSATLMDVLKYHEQNGCLEVPPTGSSQVPVIVYTMERLAGEQINTTTLKSLGIVKGSYLLRYLVQGTASERSLQLCGSGSLAKPKVARVEEPSSRVEEPSPRVEEPSPRVEEPSPRVEEPSSNSDMECAMPDSSTDAPYPAVHQRFQAPTSQVQDPVSNPDIVRSANRCEVPDVLCSDQIQSPPDVLRLTSNATTPSDSSQSFDLVTSHMVSSKPDISERVEDQPMEMGGATALERYHEADEVIPLGSHNSVLFSLDEAPPTINQEEDDAFFELSANEVQRLHMEQMRVLNELDEAPLMTERIRSLEEEGKLLSAMKNHPTTQIRIIFPDRLVIQGTFKPRDTIGVVQEFLRQFLLHPRMDFYLYTVLPKKILNPAWSLVEADCIPNARLYFGTDLPSERFIAEESLLKKSSYIGAQRALKSRSILMPASLGETIDRRPPREETTPNPNILQPSPQNREPTQRVPTNQKLPKWFKLSK